MSTTIALGASSEARAADLLERAGYRILERNYRTRRGELDLIARDGDTLVFIEVRSRLDNAHGDALESIDHHKQRQIIRTAEHYLAYRSPACTQIRFDVVGITGDAIVLVRDAFRG